MKIKVLSIGTTENKLYLKLKNDKSATSLLSYLLLKTGFEAEHEAYEHSKKENTKETDVRSSWENEDFEVDVIFGYKATFFIIRANSNKKFKFIKSVVEEVIEI